MREIKPNTNSHCFRDVNTAVMELLIMAYALKTACARNIIGVIPYFPYSKQSKMRKRGSIVCKLLASMLAKAGERARDPGARSVVQDTSLLEISPHLMYLARDLFSPSVIH